MNDIGRNRFKLSPRGVMLALVSAALSESALANTGRVDFVIGNVQVTQADGRARALQKGTELGSGDRITSGADGRAQIRFSDGAFVSVQPNTEFDIKEYRFNGKADGTESALFGLFKGAMRTITGLVGHTNRNKYQIATPTATIGIRGTGGIIQVNNDGSTLVVGTSGVWSLTNNGGTVDVPAGTAGFAGTNRNALPRLTREGPVLPPPQPRTIGPLPPTYVAGDLVNSAGQPVSIVPSVLTSGPGYAVAFFGVGGVNNTVIGTPPFAMPSNAVFNAAGQLTQFDQSLTALTTYKLGGTVADSGTDGILSWGRWTNGDVLLNGSPFITLTTNEGLHYVTGTPSPVASMPGTGNFTYNLIGATSPTFSNGASAPGVLNSASLNGNFSTSVLTINLSATAAGTTFTGSGTSTTFTSTFPTFNITGNATSVGGTAGCSGSCFLSVQGFFAGAGATRAGIEYQITGLTAGNYLVGAAAFAR